MSHHWKTAILICILIITFIALLFGKLTPIQFSAYDACRETARHTKGYGVWTYQTTEGNRIFFDDGVNILECTAQNSGPFWIVTEHYQTLQGRTYGPDPDYFGVSP